MGKISNRVRRLIIAIFSECGVTGLWALIDANFVQLNAVWFVAVSAFGLIAIWFWEQIREFLDWKRGKLTVNESDSLMVRLVPEAINGSHLHYRFTLENRGLRGLEIMEDRTTIPGLSGGPSFAGISSTVDPRFIPPQGSLDIRAMPVNDLMKIRIVSLELVYRADGEQEKNAFYYRFTLPTSAFPMNEPLNPVAHGRNTEHVGQNINESVAQILGNFGIAEKAK